MDIDIRVHNITEQLQAIGEGKVPEIILRRDQGANADTHSTSAVKPLDGSWWILNSQLPQKVENISWSQNKKSPNVRIPMLRYYLNEQ